MSRIQVHPDIHFGKPCIAGTRIPIHSVLELIRDGIASEIITRDFYPDLAPQDIEAPRRPRP